MTNVNDLRIVKLYNVHSFDRDEKGNIIGTNYSRISNNFALAKKCGNSYKIVPTPSMPQKVVAHLVSDEQYSVIVKKDRTNNKYRKPYHLCPALEGKSLTKEELITFATMIERINCERPVAETTQQLKNACEKMENIIEHSNNKEEQFSL